MEGEGERERGLGSLVDKLAKSGAIARGCNP